MRRFLFRRLRQTGTSPPQRFHVTQSLPLWGGVFKTRPRIRHKPTSPHSLLWGEGLPDPPHIPHSALVTKKPVPDLLRGVRV